jgi:large subunit ribosomal protein L1
MSKKITKLPGRSKKYSANFIKIQEATKDKPQGLPLKEAVDLLLSLETSNYKDGSTVELHAKLNINPTKSDQTVRSSVSLPNGTGKKVLVAAFVSSDKEEEAKKAGADFVGGETLVEEIKKAGSINFDKAVASPSMMKNLAPIARILGVAGVMPNPKNGTMGENLEEMVKSIKAGKVDFKNDKSGNLHLICGKVNKSFDSAKLVENIESAMEAIKKAKPEAVKKKYILTVHLSASTSPSIKVEL